jgi:hypothetical protein
MTCSGHVSPNANKIVVKGALAQLLKTHEHEAGYGHLPDSLAAMGQSVACNND